MDSKASGDASGRLHQSVVQAAALAPAGRNAADDDDGAQTEYEATGGQGQREDYLRGLVAASDDDADDDGFAAGLEEDKYERILFGTTRGEYVAGMEAAREVTDNVRRDLVRHAARWLYHLGLREHTRTLWALADDAEALRYREGQIRLHSALYAATAAVRALPAFGTAMPVDVDVKELEAVFDAQSPERRLINRLRGVEHLRDLVRHEPKEYGVELHAWESAVRARRVALVLGRPTTARASLDKRLGELRAAGFDDDTARLVASLELQEGELIGRWAAGGLCAHGERSLRQLQAVLTDSWNACSTGALPGLAA